MLDKELWRKNLDAAYGHYKRPVHRPWTEINRLTIEPTNRCNANCIMCLHKQTIEELGEQDLPLEDIKKFISNISRFSHQFGGLKGIRFGGFGEPLLYPQLPEAIEYAKKYVSNVTVTSNISLLDRSMSLSLLDAGMTWIVMSIDHCYKEGYEQMRRGLKWETILGNALQFKQIRDEGGYDCKIEVNSVITKENIDRSEDIAMFWDPVSDGGTTLFRELPIGDTWRVQPRFNIRVRRPPCTVRVVIKANGDVFGCCMDIFRRHTLGNLYKNSMTEIFNGEKIKQLRRSLANLDNIPYCCEMCRVLPMFQSKWTKFRYRVLGRGDIIDV